MTKAKDKLRVMKDLVIGEVSLVDAPMQEPARIAILKRDSESATLKRMAITSMTAGHAHSVLTANHLGGENRMGQTSYVDGHAHDWVMDEAGSIFIADALGHNHGIAVLTKDAAQQTNPDGGAPATVAGVTPAGNNQPAATSGEGNSMTPEQIAALQKQAADVTKRAERAESILKLPVEHLKILNGMTKVEDQDAFLAQTPEQREQLVKASKDANPVVFTSLDGVEYRKNDDARFVALAKQADQARTELAREQSIRKQSELEKRATETLSNFPGEVIVKSALLGAVESIKDEGTRAKALEALKAHDAGLGAALSRRGTGAAPATGSASDKLDALAKSYADANKCPLGKAYDAVVATPEGRQLYDEHRAARR